ncbi:cytochrome c oxidase subunit II [Sphingomonas sp. HDW15A]|uniref:cytochrome c oxidase subunit II n=1 Tax=Sphingomonas sp. HDW15A TaxID=2714942 RepID=UPI00140BC0BC|nr:cytochrome c oxidase subunit II [Sphingomonas sp. HDW15A]QIK95116.1 cytochrome c oxidase subunit II [Sphingomonas sp. HDW15A]
MRRFGWAIALAAAAMVPAAAAAPQANVSTVETATTAAPAADTAAAAPAATAAPATPATAPVQGLGMPDGRMGLQDQVTELGQQAADFHNYWLLTLCVVISLFVLALMVWTLLRYNRRANPTPSRNSHNTLLEVVWTLVPVLILVAIAVPSIRLLAKQYSPPPADLTIKVIGHQWYWSYQYPDNGGFEIVSNMLKEAGDPSLAPGARTRTDADGPRLLAADERLVIPAGKVVKFIVTSEDVIHSFAVPAFWTKMDANPGRLNETWVKVDKPGVYFGQCSELCGARHGYMPIAVEVVPPAKFAAWVASKGGTMPGAKPAPAADSTGSSTVTTPANPAAVAPAAPTGQPAEGTAIQQPATNQAATAQN